MVLNFVSHLSITKQAWWSILRLRQLCLKQFFLPKDYLCLNIADIYCTPWYLTPFQYHHYNQQIKNKVGGEVCQSQPTVSRIWTCAEPEFGRRIGQINENRRVENQLKRSDKQQLSKTAASTVAQSSP